VTDSFPWRNCCSCWTCVRLR